MRQALALLLVVTLAGELCGGQEKIPVRDQICAIAPNSPVEVRFRDGSKLRGWISDVSDSGFVLKHEIKHQLQDSQFPFDSVRSVKAVKSVHPSHTTRNILIGVGIAVVVIGGVLAGGLSREGSRALATDLTEGFQVSPKSDALCWSMLLHTKTRSARTRPC